MRRLFAASALAALLALSPALPAQDASVPVLKVTTQRVLTDVVVRDKATGQPVRGLHKEDFEILEDGKPQTISSFDSQDVDEAAEMAAPVPPSKSATLGTQLTQASSAEQLHGHRLIVLFFDTTSLQPDDLERVQGAARDFVDGRMQPADLVSVVSLGSTLSVDQDFTADKAALLRAIASYSPAKWKTQAPTRRTRPTTTT
jgi:VWFA-related protein